MTAMTQPASPFGDVRFDFRDRVAIVTGATGGIGGAIAGRFAAAGASLVVHGRREDALDDVVERVRAQGRDAVAVAGNIRDPETAAEIVAAAEQRFGRVDVLVNNAGGNFGARLDELSVNAWNAMLEANLSGAFHLAKAALPTFRRRGGGSVVNIGSASAGHAHPLRGAYAAAKAGLASLTRTMAWEWADANVRVNCLEPGAVATAASRFAAGEVEARVARFVALNRLGTPDDIASVCLFLCSTGASYLTGQTVIVNGGPHTATPADIDLVRAP
ncbi:SDR family NAD(P)-dependent oxidoreductase [Amycolatopsis saalfeldensis]|uniref:Enoyl-(Acyl carrier protein) reductase n=1 Tax=Amycolatopsis saalfeldensis TaxID=394193 RepID=A0A1H8XCK6_9PSEU|nr:glucose 1-dehydrogenase [Amycolatopsis saalfeldensis]SEP37724.1 Enoyl-(Acyl carrier protein) reductase [Amycolatopsis saalfeldensis]